MPRLIQRQRQQARYVSVFAFMYILCTTFVMYRNFIVVDLHCIPIWSSALAYVQLWSSSSLPPAPIQQRTFLPASSSAKTEDAGTALHLNTVDDRIRLRITVPTASADGASSLADTMYLYSRSNQGASLGSVGSNPMAMAEMIERFPQAQANLNRLLFDTSTSTLKPSSNAQFSRYHTTAAALARNNDFLADIDIERQRLLQSEMLLQAVRNPYSVRSSIPQQLELEARIRNQQQLQQSQRDSIGIGGFGLAMTTMPSQRLLGVSHDHLSQLLIAERYNTLANLNSIPKSYLAQQEQERLRMLQLQTAMQGGAAMSQHPNTLLSSSNLSSLLMPTPVEVRLQNLSALTSQVPLPSHRFRQQQEQISEGNGRPASKGDGPKKTGN